MKKLSELLAILQKENQLVNVEQVKIDKEKYIKEITISSSAVDKDSLFICIKGHKDDGHNYIEEAVRRGAACIITNKIRKINGSPTIVQVKDTKEAAGLLASTFFGMPQKYLKLIGITGTTGKTTTVYLIYSILPPKKTIRLTTVDYKFPLSSYPSTLTTPDPITLYRLLSVGYKEGAEVCVLEVSSHALKQKRIFGCEFDIAVFTNIGRDHLDYHSSFKDYINSKIKLFSQYLKSDGTAVINADDIHCAQFLNTAKLNPTITYGLSSGAKVRPKKILSLAPITFEIDDMVICVKNLFGKHNLYNVLAAISVGQALGIDLESIKTNLEQAQGPPGRFQFINLGQKYHVIVDYAHTPEAFEALLISCRELLHPNKLLVVFGCGGERDRGKRPKMGALAQTLSDYIYLTNDNPRNEDPYRIIKDIRKGIISDNCCEVIPDRREAIYQAISRAKENDVVVIAGKGHEPYQIIKGEKIAFDDVKVAEECIRCSSMKKCW